MCFDGLSASIPFRALVLPQHREEPSATGRRVMPTHRTASRTLRLRGLPREPAGVSVDPATELAATKQHVAGSAPRVGRGVEGGRAAGSFLRGAAHVENRMQKPWLVETRLNGVPRP